MEIDYNLATLGLRQVAIDVFCSTYIEDQHKTDTERFSLEKNIQKS